MIKMTIMRQKICAGYAIRNNYLGKKRLFTKEYATEEEYNEMIEEFKNDTTWFIYDMKTLTKEVIK